MTTYVQLVNKVMVGLRENEVADITNGYAKLIGQFVNEAKRAVEGRWHWKALRHEVDVATSAATRSYAMSGTTNKSVLLYDRYGMPMAFRTDSGSKAQLSEMSREDMRRYLETQNTVQNGEPTCFAIDRGASSLTVYFDPLPDTAYNYRFVMYTPQAELSDKDDVLSVPEDPVWTLALVYAMEERGSEFQGSLTSRAERAQQAMDEAVLIEQGVVEQQTFVEA